MRRKVIGVAGVVVLAIAALAPGGCAKPPGVDGILTNGWPALPEPKIPVPEALVCYNVQTDDPSEVAKWPVAVKCDEPHTVETIYVGQFTGADAERTSPPSSGGPERRKAYEECSRLSKDFLGGDWRTARLGLFLVLPSTMHWDAGARHYRCDVVQYTNIDDMTLAVRSDSLKGGLTSSPALLLGCASIDQTTDKIDTLLPAGCASSHNAEFTGIFENPDGPYPDDQEARSKAALTGCRAVVSAYVGIPNDGNFQYRTGQVVSPFPKAAWELGNRGVRCYLWLSGKTFTRSLKGTGTAGLPINYG